jgi:hypothetical protein
VARELRNELKSETERGTGKSELESLSEKAAIAEHDYRSSAKMAAQVLHGRIPPVIMAGELEIIRNALEWHSKRRARFSPIATADGYDKAIQLAEDSLAEISWVGCGLGRRNCV